MRLTTAILAAMLLAAGPVAAQAGKVGDFGWLAGERKFVQGPVTTYERWTAPADNLMLGVSRTLRGTRAVAFEFLRIQSRGDTVFYIAQPNGRPPTEFRLTTWDGTQAVFENPTHDFPKRILYRRMDGGAVLARIDGGEGVAEGALEFLFRP